MKLVLVDKNKDLCEEWGKQFKGYNDVLVFNESYENLGVNITDFDYFVTAGNSFGIMNGGIDLAVRELFGVNIQDAVQWCIAKNLKGFLPVGKMVIIDGLAVYDVPCKLIYLATMEFPMRVDIYNLTVSFLALLREFSGEEHKDTTIVCCGLATGVGGIPPVEAAIVMRDIYDFAVRTCRYTERVTE